MPLRPGPLRPREERQAAASPRGGVESKDRGFPERLLESERELAGVQLKCALDFLGQA